MRSHRYGQLVTAGLMLSLSVSTTADEHSATLGYPSAELLEFLAEFGEADDETLDLIEFHALQHERKPSPETKHEE